MIKYEAKKTEGVQFTMELPKELNEYAKNFLAIFNNAREYPENLLKVENNYKGDVFVTVPKRKVDICRDFLSQFGEIKYEEDVNIFEMTAVYDEKGRQEIWEERGDEAIEPVFVIDIE